MNLVDLERAIGKNLGAEVTISQIGTRDHVTYYVRVGPLQEPNYLITLARDHFKPGPIKCWGHVWSREGPEYTLNEGFPDGAPAQELLAQARGEHKEPIRALFHKLT